MRKKIIWLYIGIISGIWSCESVIEIDNHLDKLPVVVNSIFGTDSTWSVTVLNSKHVLDRNHTLDENISNEFDTIKNAQVGIMNETTGEEVTLALGDKHKYVLNTTPQDAGDRFTLRVEIPDHSPLTATCLLPVPVQIESASVDKPDGYAETTTLNITFIDPPGVENYYELFITGLRYFRSKDPSIDFETSFDNRGRGMLFSDNLFDGQTKTLPLEIFNPYLTNEKEEYHIILRSLSGDYYNYSITVQLQEDGTGDPFAQPVQVYNNIQNGVGIFAGFSSSSFLLEVE